MTNFRISGPMCYISNAIPIDNGTMCRTASTSPAIVGASRTSVATGTASTEALMCRPTNVETQNIPDFSSREGTMAAIVAECNAQGLALKTQIAYVLATVDHETKHTFRPVTEAYWLSDPDAYLKKHHNDYYPYYGRGFVQITWKTNYEKYGKLTGRDLVKHPELALDPEIALFVLVHGFRTGSFTGRKLDDYINNKQTDYINARRCINGLDKAQEIANLTTLYIQKI